MKDEFRLSLCRMGVHNYRIQGAESVCRVCGQIEPYTLGEMIKRAKKFARLAIIAAIVSAILSTISAIMVLYTRGVIKWPW